MFTPGPNMQFRLDAGATATDSGALDSSAADAGGQDLSTPDLGTGDLGPSDLSTADLGRSDLGAQDLGSPDLGSPDQGAPDMGGCTPGAPGWQKLGASLDALATADTNVNAVTLAIDDQNAPVVAWTEGGPSDLYVSRFNGSAWQPLGPPISENPGTTNAYNPSLGAGHGQLVLFWMESGGANGTGAYARRWTGSDWELMGGGDLSTDSASVVGADVYIADNGDPIIAFSQGTPRRIVTRRFTGLAYVPLTPDLGGIPGPGASAITPFISQDSAGRVMIAFSESGVRIWGRNAAGTDWEPVGAGEIIPLGTSAHTPRMSRRGPGANPIIALEEYDGTAAHAFVYQWTGFNWAQMGGTINRVPAASHANLKAVAVDSQDRPVIAWTEGADNMNTQLFVQRYDGTDFVDVGALPLSAFAGAQSVASAEMVIDACDRPVIAFTEAPVGGDRSVHVYRFEGP